MDMPVIFRPDPREDPDGSKLRGALESHLRCERARSLRRTMMAVMLAPGSVLWARAIWPGLGGEEARGFAVYGWFACCAAVAFAALSEWRWQRASAHFTAP